MDTPHSSSKKSTEDKTEGTTEETTSALHWADHVAQKVLKEKGDKPQYVCAAGITPSGTVHIGNFREMITVDLVARALRDALKGTGKKVRFIYSWDDYDVFRKIPKNMPHQEELHKHLRMPITKVPDPFGCHASYAEHHEKEVEDIIPLVGVHPEFLHQYQKYHSCVYKDYMVQALENTPTIKKILDKYREEPLRKDWLPVSIFCDKCMKDTIKHIKYLDNYDVEYSCECGNKEVIDFSKKGIVKLLWRVDWPMRWKFEEVDFEPGGKEHSTVGGSYTTAKEIVKEVWHQEPPIYHKYEFISIKGKGGKISSSLGNVITLKDMLEIYEPDIVRYLFASTRAHAEFAISFDLDVLKIYEDFDRCERIYFKTEIVEEKEYQKQKRIYELSAVNPHKIPHKQPYQPTIRHLCNYVQVYHGDIHKVVQAVKQDAHNEFDEERLKIRTQCAWNWLQKYAPEEMRWTLQDKVHIQLNEHEKNAFKAVAELLKKEKNEINEQQLFEGFYTICKEHSVDTKHFFKLAYNLLIKKDKGPKLAPFLLVIKDQALKLFEEAGR